MDMLPRYVEECRQTKPKTLWETDNAHSINTYLISQILNTEAGITLHSRDWIWRFPEEYVPINRTYLAVILEYSEQFEDVNCKGK